MRKPALAVLLVAGVSLAACATYRLEKRLEPESREFLSKVRYLISNKERKEFVNLPPAARPGFIDSFWVARDPKPETPENEFKDEYFRRIAEANRLFNEGGGAESGWLQDRGRIYILLGPPTDRLTYPRGVTFYGKPTEIWYYNFFPIIFVDEAWNGHYKLDPSSPGQLAEIMRAQMEWKPKPRDAEKGILTFEAEIEKLSQGKALARLKVPYPKIWMETVEGGFSTTLSVNLEVRDSSDLKVLEYSEDYPVNLTQERLEKIMTEDYVIEIPLSLEDGSYVLIAKMTNSADSSTASRKLPFVL